MITKHLTKTIVILLTLSIVFYTRINLYAQGMGNCADGQIKIESDPFTYTDPQGLPISSIWIKAGSAQSTDDNQCTQFDQDSNNGCYSVTGIGTSTVTAQKVGDGPDCKDISHIEIVLVQAENTPTTINTPTPTLTLTSTPTPLPTDTPEVTSQPNPTSTPLPTSTQSPQPTSTPTPGPIGGGETNNLEQNTSSQTETKTTGQVLGVSTMANTGSFTEIAQHLTNLIGFAFLAKKFKKNAPKKNN